MAQPPLHDAQGSGIDSADATRPSPEKYIRTYEADLATLKQGARPDLVPFAEPAEPAKQEVMAPVPSLPAEPPPLIPVEPPIKIEPVPEPPPIQLREKFQEPEKKEPPPVPVAPPPPPTTPRLDSEAILKTYSGDFSQQMKEAGASSFTVLAAQEDARPVSAAPQEETRGSGKKSLPYIVAGIILLLTGAAGSTYAYLRYSASLRQVILSPSVSAPIVVDESEKISGTGTTLLQAIEQSVTRPLDQGSVRLLYTADATTTGQSVFSALQLPAPGILLRNLDAQNSMAGIVRAGNTQSPFFILSVASYRDTFAGMLAWEPTMPESLVALFPPTGATSTTSAARASATLVIAGAFRDETVANHDVRIFRDATKHSIVLYGYWDPKTLVIARDPEAFRVILDRLSTSRSP